MLTRLRLATALVALAALGGLIVAPSSGPVGVAVGAGPALRLLLLPLAATMLGLGLGRSWARWLALSGAVAVLPWAAVLLVAPGPVAPPAGAAVALAAALVLLGSLLGRAMLHHYEGPGARRDWRQALVRATLVLNGASALNLYLFVAAYRARVEWHTVIPALTLAGLLGGLLLLARGKTAGLLLVAVSCILFVPAGGYFALAEAGSSGEAVLFIGLFLPGIGAALATLLAFGAPMLRLLREDA